MKATVMYGAGDIRNGTVLDVLEGGIEPGRVFDRAANLDGVPEGYRAMNERKALKVIINF